MPSFPYLTLMKCVIIVLSLSFWFPRIIFHLSSPSLPHHSYYTVLTSPYSCYPYSSLSPLHFSLIYWIHLSPASSDGSGGSCGRPLHHGGEPHLRRQQATPGVDNDQASVGLLALTPLQSGVVVCFDKRVITRHTLLGGRKLVSYCAPASASHHHLLLVLLLLCPILSLPLSTSSPCMLLFFPPPSLSILALPSLTGSRFSLSFIFSLSFTDCLTLIFRIVFSHYLNNKNLPDNFIHEISGRVVRPF